MKHPLLEIQHLGVQYQGQTAVRDFSVSVHSGEILGIVGESGSGKSTVLKAVMGLLGQDGYVDGGKIFYDGRALDELSREELRCLRGEKLAMIFQDPGGSLCPVRTIEEQLYEMASEHRSMAISEIRERIGSLCIRLGLKDYQRVLRSYPFELSGGMNQRVGILMAMLLKPDLILADEPTSALDVRIQAQAVHQMMEMRREYGTAILMVTHNIGIVEYMADKIAVMKNGELVEYGTKEQIITHPKQNYTKDLLAAVPRICRR